MNTHKPDSADYWHARAEEAYARASEMRDFDARQTMRHIAGIYNAMALRIEGLVSKPQVASEITQAANEAFQRVEDAIEKLGNGVDTVKKLKVKAEDRTGEREI
jgi:hypothetical protein